MNYDVIVVGGGHAGCEACLASSRMNHPTLLITGNINNIADAPCNPSIGGPAKGNVVREIDALGGEMGKNTDKSILQIKKLNTKKGPAVWALRAQIDKVDYHNNMLETINNQKNLTVKEGMVEDLLIKDNKIYGVKLSTGEEIYGKSVILTTGIVFAKDIDRYIKTLFNLSEHGIGEQQIESAISDNYIQYDSSKYIKSNDISYKLEYTLLNDINMIFSIDFIIFYIEVRL